MQSQQKQTSLITGQMQEQQKQMLLLATQTKLIGDVLIKQNSVKEKSNFTQLMYEQTIMDKFEVTFPINNDEVFEYFTRINLYIERNPNIMNKHLFDDVIKSLPRARLEEWITYKNEQLMDKLETHIKFNTLAPSEQSQIKLKYIQTINTFDSFKTWILSIFIITPNHTTFESLFDNINIRYHEDPTKLIRRLQQYFKQITNVINLLNRTTYRGAKHKIKDLSDRDKYKILYRVFITNNWNKQFNNYGKNNEKMRMNILKAIQENGQTFETILTAIKEQNTKIIPLALRDYNNDKYHWKNYPLEYNEASIFLINQIPSRSRKRNLSCNSGTDCQYWQNGNCRFYHNYREMKCSHCGIIGHPKKKCYEDNKSDTQLDDESTPNIAHYDPTQTINATKPLNELQKLRDKLSKHDKQQILTLAKYINDTPHSPNNMYSISNSTKPISYTTRTNRFA